MKKKFSIKKVIPVIENQTDLFDQENIPVIKEKNGFPEYHKNNPQIYDQFKVVTLEAIAIGHKHFASEFIFNQMRWKSPVSGDDQFKINNNYKAFYARLFMQEFPEHDGIFRIRESKYDEQFINQ